MQKISIKLRNACESSTLAGVKSGGESGIRTRIIIILTSDFSKAFSSFVANLWQVLNEGGKLCSGFLGVFGTNLGVDFAHGLGVGPAAYLHDDGFWLVEVYKHHGGKGFS